MTEGASNGAAAPNPADFIQPLAEKPPKRSLMTDVDALAEDALRNKPAAPKPRTGPPTKTERRSAEAEVDAMLDDSVETRAGGRDFGTDPEDDEPAERKPRKPREAEGDELPPAAELEPDDAPPEQESDEGTKKKPYVRDDLPEDRFVKVKVDGQETVVSLRDLADGYAGQKAIQQRLERIGLERQAMTREVESAKDEVKKTNDHFRAMLSDPEEFYQLLSHADFEPTLHVLAKKRWDDLAMWRKNPSARAEFERQRNERAFQQQQQRMQQQQQLQAQAQQEQQQLEHRTKVIKPGWEEGLRRAGNPDVNHPEFLPLAQTFLDLATKKERMATTDEVASAVVRAAKALGLKPLGAGAPPPKKNIIPSRSAAAPNQPRNGKGRWDAIPRQQRTNNPDYFMTGMKLRG
jgi:hypothetical protein